MDNICFWPHTRNKNIASYRLRCLSIIERLKKAGLNVDIHKENRIPRTLVLSKRYDLDTINYCLSIKRKFNVKLVLDICDNHFYDKENNEISFNRKLHLTKAIDAVDEVISSSEYLANIIKQETGKVPVVIEDVIEKQYKSTNIDIVRNLKDYLSMKKTFNQLDQLNIDKANRLIWFGNHGSSNADGGMNDLSKIYNHIEEFKTHNISITIVSNSMDKYQFLTQRWKINSFYLRWNRFFFSEVLNKHGLSVIPATLNPFTMAKTSNRVTTSLTHGLNVLSDAIPSYEKYKEKIYIGNWEDNLSRLILDKDKKPTLSKAEILEHNLKITNKWISVLK